MTQPRSILSPGPALVSVLLALGSSWVLPLRMSTQEATSYYAFALVGDESYYAERLAPLIEGTTSNNPHNGVGDPHVISPLFLENLLREFVTLSGVDVIAFFWAWRVLFPVAMFVLLLWLVRGLCGRLRRRPFSESLIFAALAYGIIHFGYELCAIILSRAMPQSFFPMLQGWIMRIPSGTEYLLSIAVLIALWRLLVRRDLGGSVALAVAMAALIYFRPYAAVAWAPACALAVIWSAAAGSLPFRTILVCAAAGIALLAPWIFIDRFNHSLPLYQQMMIRYFGETPYAVHECAPLYVILGAAIAASGFLLRGRSRRLIVSLGATLLILPFIAALPSNVRAQLLLYDRFGCYYLVAAMAAVMLLLQRYGLARVRFSPLRPVMAAGAAMLLCGAVLFRNAAYDLTALRESPYASMLRENRYVAGYSFVKNHTPADAWVLLDDGIEWTKVPAGDRNAEHALYQKHWEEDLFSVVARRKRFTHLRLYTCPISNDDLVALMRFQRSTFGLASLEEARADRVYRHMLDAFKPGYIFWKRDAPAPRGRGARLKDASDVVYSDTACEVWKIRYPDALKVFDDTSIDANADAAK